jgi:hypothetical protein
MDAAGNFVVVWISVDQDGSQEGIFAQRFNAGGAPQGQEFRVNATTSGRQSVPQVGMDPSGNFVVAWHGPDADRSGVFAQRFDAAGTALGAELSVNTFTADTQSNPSVAVDPAGAFVVTWEDFGLTHRNIFGQRFAASGQPAGGEFRVNTTTVATSFTYSAVAKDAAGGFVVAWERNVSAPPVPPPAQSFFFVHFQRFDGAGSPVGVEYGVPSDRARRPAVATNAVGNALLVWENHKAGRAGIFGQHFDTAGMPLGAEFRISEVTTLSVNDPSIAIDSSGRFVVVWGALPPGGDFDVFGRRFEPLGAAGLAVDASPTAGSDGNGVLEPGELVAVEPSWRNMGVAAQSFGGSAAAFTGPGVPGNPTYTIDDGAAGYGPIAVAAAASCREPSPDCYALSVSVPSIRPVQHWDATLDETLIPLDEHGATQRWTVHVGDSFADVPRSNPFYRFIETLLHNGVTGGCTGTAYCPAVSTARGQMAVFTLVAKEGPSYSPPACEPPNIFTDVPESSSFCRWIEELSRRGVVSGCGPGLYCPGDAVSRQQMAVFVLGTLDPGLDPPACVPPNIFTDVPETSLFCRWIEELARRGVVAGCAPGLYCPAQPVSRAQMGVFISVTFGLSLYGP